ncbi:diacylglycerol kinase [Atlantibacter hermannii]|uniref:diacylglycerol kinase n=1 Tax=Atlantibacter hermannii TaxID=565 RepID=UPI0005C23CBB|nr:diacylglycerol kinase [Atlantibacter hermannii]MCQ4969424.1 diacylglycerol kinase [Enterobacteriaceae bacterium DFI.7.85]MDQ7883481.1 diacylglycerol kinase [Atlantibacter hermannii]
MHSSGPIARGKYNHGKTGIARIASTFSYSWAGFRTATRNEAAFRQLLVIQGILIAIALTLDVSRSERALMVAVCLLSLIVELLNSAIEAAVDRVSLEHHPLAKNAKDMGSAAQAVALLMVMAVWGIVMI